MVEKPSTGALVVRSPTQSGLIAVPGLISGAGAYASHRFLEFFAATIRNKNTREAYFRAVCRFFAWCEKQGLHELPDIEPLHMALYVEQMLQKPRKGKGKDAKDPTANRRSSRTSPLSACALTGL